MHSSRPLLVAIGLAGLFGVVELPFASFMADDLIQLGFLEGDSPADWIGPFELYTISDGDPEHVQVMKDAGAFPWFFDPAFEMDFFRPTSSGLLALDHALFGLNPLGYRAHGALWFVALAAGVGLLLRRALPTPVGGLALLLFTVSGIHGILCWTATRHIVISAALAVAGLVCHVRWREAGWRPGGVLAVVGFALALTASEAAVAVLAYLFAYEAFGASGTRGQRVRAVLPAAGLLAAYLVTYAVLGFGTSGGSGYVNPMNAPGSFLVQLPGRWLFLIGSMLAGGNADVWVLRPDLRPGLIAFGALSVTLMALFLRRLWAEITEDDRRAARWLLTGAVLSAIPFTGTPIGSRCLVIPLLGGSVAVALVLHGWWTRLRKTPGVKVRLLGACCVLLGLIHLGFAPLQRLASPLVLRQMMHDRLVTEMDDPLFAGEQLAGRTVVILHAPDIVLGFHSYFHRTLHRLAMPDSWRVLSWAPHDHRFTRTADDTLLMQVVGGSMEGGHLETGDIIRTEGVTATVLEMGRIGPSQVSFRFDRSLDSPDLVTLAWIDGALLQLQAPPLDGSLLVPFTSGP